MPFSLQYTTISRAFPHQDVVSRTISVVYRNNPHEAMYAVPDLGTSPMMRGVWEVINFLISVRESLIDRKGGGKSASCLVLLRIHFLGAVYYTIAPGNGGQKTFLDEPDYQLNRRPERDRLERPNRPVREVYGHIPNAKFTPHRLATAADVQREGVVP